MKRKLMEMNKYAVAFCADYNYTDKVMTTIKSICAHNRGMRFYVLNDNIPQEWFINIRRKLKAFDCEIEDKKVAPVGADLQTNAHVLASAACLKFLIPQEIEEDTVLYLDSDIIVTGDITHLFSLDFSGGGYLIGAVNDGGHQTDLWRMGIYNTFNAGVILWNNKACRKEQITGLLLEAMDTYKDQITLADQSILNIVLDGKWHNLGINYNCLLMTNFNGADEQRGHNFGKITQLPTILHYASSQKPWSPYCWMQLKELWWYYNGLEWSELAFSSTSLSEKKRPSCLILTASGNIEQVEYLVSQLPEYNIHIAAYTVFSPNIMMLAKYPNAKIHPNILQFLLADLVQECDAYLDINHGSEVEGIVGRMHELGTPVFAFDTTNKDQQEKSHVFPISQKEALVEALKKLYKERET